MLPYFFAVSHWNYARDGTAYLRLLEKYPNTLLNLFLDGKHVFIEQMGYGTGSGVP